MKSIEPRQWIYLFAALLPGSCSVGFAPYVYYGIGGADGIHVFWLIYEPKFWLNLAGISLGLLFGYISIQKIRGIEVLGNRGGATLIFAWISIVFAGVAAAFFWFMARIV